MSKFNKTVTSNGVAAKIFFEGALEDLTDLCNIDLSKFKEIEISLEKIERVNSNGLRAWLTWVSRLDQSKKYSVKKCSRIFASLANTVLGVLPTWIEIQSIEIPYHCQKCGSSFASALALQHPVTAPVPFAKGTPCVSCGTEASFDGDSSEYFLFLTRRP